MNRLLKIFCLFLLFLCTANVLHFAYINLELRKLNLIYSILPEETLGAFEKDLIEFDRQSFGNVSSGSLLAQYYYYLFSTSESEELKNEYLNKSKNASVTSLLRSPKDKTLNKLVEKISITN